MLEPTGRARIQLIRANNAWGDDGKIIPQRACPSSGYSHLARAWIGETAVEERDGIYDVVDRSALVVAHDDPRWPTECECGYKFTSTDSRTTTCHTIYRNAETGEEYLLRDAPAGAMWYADWMLGGIPPERVGPGTFRGPDGHCLMVQLPDGHEWCVDGPATNGPGWERTGTPPNVTAMPSIGRLDKSGGWIYHGWLRNGVLVDA
jgi:hypothetical protein